MAAREDLALSHGPAGIGEHYGSGAGEDCGAYGVDGLVWSEVLIEVYAARE